MAYWNSWNLRATLAKPPWAEPLNWNLHMTITGEGRIPFCSHVEFGAIQPAPSPPSLFQHFNRLPAELQLRILNFCSAPTLYQVMRTSKLRTEAAKLFWADPNTYYLIQARWIFKGGQPGNTRYDLSFMAHTQYIEIEWDHSAEDEVRGPSFGAEIDYNKVREFWSTFLVRFPAAKKVVINSERPPWGPEYTLVPFPECLKVIVEAAPVRVGVTAFVIARRSCEDAAIFVCSNYRRAFHRFTEGSGWKEVTASDSMHKTVLMPLKRIHGPVGEFTRSVERLDRMQLQLYGLNALAIEALDRNYFDKEDPEPFHCSFSGCDVYFEKAGQCTQHAAEVHSFDLIFRSQFDDLPNALQYVFEERKNEIEQKMETLRKWGRDLAKDWHEEDGEKRREIERAWKYQLENDKDWDTGTEWMESEIWKWFGFCMWATNEEE